MRASTRRRRAQLLTNLQADVTITIDPTKTHAISPWIYGINSASGVPNAPHFTLDRHGRQSLDSLQLGNQRIERGQRLRPVFERQFPEQQFHSGRSRPSDYRCRSKCRHGQLDDGATPRAGGCGRGWQRQRNNPPDLYRFNHVIFKKSLATSDPFTVTPDTTDSNVYMDEFVWALDQKFPGQGIFGANPQHPTFVSLDNEPELWNSTHLETSGHDSSFVVNFNYENHQPGKST